jgi:hypothetical protein
MVPPSPNLSNDLPATGMTPWIYAWYREYLLCSIREFTENKIPNFKIIPCYYKVL